MTYDRHARPTPDVELGTWGRDASSRCAASSLCYGPSGDAPQPKKQEAVYGRKGRSGHDGRVSEVKRGLAGPPGGQVRRPGVDDPERLQRRHHVSFDGGDHLRVQRLVQAQQGLAAQGVDPVAGARRQEQLLARDEVFGQAPLAPGV